MVKFKVGILKIWSSNINNRAQQPQNLGQLAAAAYAMKSLHGCKLFHKSSCEFDCGFPYGLSQLNFRNSWLILLQIFVKFGDLCSFVVSLAAAVRREKKSCCPALSNIVSNLFWNYCYLFLWWAELIDWLP